MIDAYFKFITLTFNVKEKTSRKDYWLATFANLVILALFAAGADGFVRILTDVMLPRILDIIFAFAALIWMMFAVLFIIGTLLPNLTMSFRRYKDTGISSWFFLVELALYLAAFIYLSQYVLNGYATILTTLLTVFFLLADVLIKLLPSERDTEAESAGEVKL
ncbi:DUF805 domain-containing protein [Fructobacillus sp. W13]|uniref:DUF805 domain-containing protein n=1 Tax=Fructobacillus apis TaxID=2935017 RepID=A0ABT0ZPP4_9LACO|nr:DUF805 domain-containing protein [Fructobacillus apis]MCO0831971.1 DUF805 domain-containing protein [Fructobacillus apis]